LDHPYEVFFDFLLREYFYKVGRDIAKIFISIKNDEESHYGVIYYVFYSISSFACILSNNKAKTKS